MINMQLVDSLYQIELFSGTGRGQPVDASPRQAQKLALGNYTQRMPAVNHCLALSNPALLSAPSKKSFSRGNGLIFACRTFESASDGPEGLNSPSLAKSPATFSSACWRNWMIWLGCSSNCSASSATVLSPLKAAKATLARNSGEKVLRGRLIEMLLGTQRLNDQRPIINCRPVSIKWSDSNPVNQHARVA